MMVPKTGGFVCLRRNGVIGGEFGPEELDTWEGWFYETEETESLHP